MPNGYQTNQKGFEFQILLPNDVDVLAVEILHKFVRKNAVFDRYSISLYMELKQFLELIRIRTGVVEYSVCDGKTTRKKKQFVQKKMVMEKTMVQDSAEK